VIVRAEGIYVWDSEGARMLDAMSGLWCVNVGYGRIELADAAHMADDDAAVLQQLLPDHQRAGDDPGGEAGRTGAACRRPQLRTRVLFVQRQ
jgi:hypothetical protein